MNSLSPPTDDDVGPAHDSIFTLHQADALTLENHLQVISEQKMDDAQFVDVTITSPPYSDQKDYGYDEALQVGQDQTYEEYLEDLRSVFRQTYNITKETGSLWVVANTVKNNGRTVRLPFDIADVLENLPGKQECDSCGERLEKDRATGVLECPSCGASYNVLADSWTLQDIVIWDKVRARPWSNKGSMRNVFEYILFFSKGSDFVFELDDIRVADPAELKEWWVEYPHRYHPRGKVPDNIWKMVTPNQGAYGDGTLDHPAPFPPDLVERIIRLTTEKDDVIFDPFAGTGTVLAQAEVMDRRALGFELSEEYVTAFDEVRASIHADWNTEDGSLPISEQQEQMQDIILGLRQVKYGRELIRVVRKYRNNPSLTELGVNSVILLSNGPAPESFKSDRFFVELDVIIVMDDRVTQPEYEALLRTAQDAKADKPCSTFGIKSNISVMSSGDLKNSTPLIDWAGEELFLYTEDNQTHYEREIAIEELVEELKEPDIWRDLTVSRENPAIVSNIGLKVDDPETDFTQGKPPTFRYELLKSDGSRTVTTID